MRATGAIFDAICRARKLSGSMRDLFGGSGGVAVACLREGMPSLAFDTQLRSSDNLSSWQFLQFAAVQLLAKRVSVIHAAPPCSSFSVAVSRSGRAGVRKNSPGVLRGLREMKTYWLSMAESVPEASLKSLSYANNCLCQSLLRIPRRLTFGTCQKFRVSSTATNW